MFIEVACIAAGVPVGYRTKKLPTFVSLIGKMTTWAVYALLFLLGLSLGNNDAVFARIPELGLRSLVISVFALLGSVGITFFVERFCLRDTLSIPQESSAHAPSSNHAENPTERSCPIQASSLQQADRKSVV